MPNANAIESEVRLTEQENLTIRSIAFKDDGRFPNSSLPLLLYCGALKMEGRNGAFAIEQLYRKAGWGNIWRDGVYAYQHYHSIAHEVLACYTGAARVLFGGPDGEVIQFQQGDVVIIPAGVAHRNLGSSDEFGVVGAYPPGQFWDMNYGSVSERMAAIANISKVPLPATDPVYGKEGPLVKFWGARPKV